MDEINNSQENKPTPEEQVKRAKIILWLGLSLIVGIGLAIAIFYIFLK